ncbi:MAG: hypothetical protein AABY22_33105 [Nanoarchaeota archaeon]
MPAKLNIDYCILLAKKHDGKCLSKMYLNSQTKYSWECKNGHVWDTKYSIVQQGSWCPECIGLKKKTIQYCVEIATDRGGKCLSKKYINNKIELLWECSNFHMWEARPDVIFRGIWCPKCSVQKRQETNLKKFGTKYPSLNKDIQEKTKNTNRVKYGVDYPTQNKEIRLKAAKSANKTTPIINWKTGEIIYMLGWEPKVAEYFNENKINYIYEPKTFNIDLLTKTGCIATYTPDFYLPDKDLYIEVKGRKYKKNMVKWQKFLKVYHNSQLWDEKKLKELGIL